MILLAVLFILLVPAGFLTDETRPIVRALARAHVCNNPSLSAQMKDGGVMEITVACLAPGEAEP